MKPSLAEMLRDSPYLGYSYAYPHKTAYRPFAAPLSLSDLWASENRDALFLYLHVPFCEMRCGFCNLFTQAQPKAGLAEQYLHQLRQQAEQVREALGDASFARFAIGGGTPTFLDLSGLEALFDIATQVMGADPSSIPCSVETSPATAEAEKLALLRQRGIDRISIGVQSFLEAETSAVARPQRTSEVEAALKRIRDAGFPVLNIDLIYGLPGQTLASWLESLRRALSYRPEELYLYPLYVRPLTSLGQSRRTWDDLRLACYRTARALLESEGYQQVSMRMFRAAHAPSDSGPAYCCQQDGMVGLGCGARSYTRTVHYSTEYAVRARGVREILADYLAQPAEAFRSAIYGFTLDEEEQHRRYVVQSLLQVEGLALTDFQRRFGTKLFEDLPELIELEQRDLAQPGDDTLALTRAGLEFSDVIGPWLYSPKVWALMENYTWR
jgi:oxygen-independent coproporphyrinogen-3 oxidase